MLLLATGVLSCLAVGPARAQTTTYWWDAGSNPGNWSTTDLNWNTSAASGGSVVAWDTSGDYAVFSNSNYAAASAGTATLTVSTTALGIDFASGSTTIAASYAPGSGSLTLAGNLITGATTTVTGPTTFDTSLGTLGVNGNLTWTNTSGQSVVVNCVLAPSATTGAGTTSLYFGYNQGNQLANPYTFIFNGVISDNGVRKLFLNTQVTSGNVNNPYYIELTAANTFTGGSIIGGSGAGGFAITNSAALGTGQVNFNGGCLEPLNNPITLSNPIIITTSNNYINGNQPFTISNSVVSEGVYSGTEELGVNDAGLVTLAGPVYWNNSNTTGNISKQPTISGSGSITITGNIYNNNAGNTQAMNWAYNGTGVCTLTASNGNSGGVFLTGAGVLQASNTAGFGTGTGLSSTNTITGTTNVLYMTAGTLGLLNDLSVTFGTAQGVGPSGGYNFTVGGNAAIKVDNVTYPGSPADGTTGQTLTLGSGTIGANTLTFVNGHSYSLSMGTLSATAGLTIANNMISGTASLAALTYTAASAGSVIFNGGSSTALTSVGPIGQQGGGVLSLNQSGSGALLLTGGNNYAGTTTISGGTLALGQAGGVGATLGTGPVVVGPGAFAVTPLATTNSNNSIGGSLTLNSGAAFSMADGFANTFNVSGSASLAPASGAQTTLTFDVGGGRSDVLAIGGGVAVGSASASIAIDGFGSTSLAGSYNVITAASGLGNNFALASNSISFGGANYSLSLAGNSTSETVILANETTYSKLYYNGGGGTAALNASSGSNTNFSIDSGGTNNSGAQPTSATSVFFTAGNVTLPQTIRSLGQSYSFNSLAFTPNSPSIALSDSSGNTLTVLAAIANGSPNNQVLNVPLTAGGALTITNSGSGTLTLSGGVNAGSNLLTFAGSGATVISGTAALSTSVGASVSSGAGPVTIFAPVSLGGASTFTNNGASGLNLGAVNAGNNALVIAGAGSTTISGVISGSGALTMNGSGTLTLNGSNTYGGGATVEMGVLVVQNGLALGTANANALSATGTAASLWLESSTGITVANNITTTGDGGGGGGLPTEPGVIQNAGGNNVLSGLITLTSGGGSSVYKSNSGSLTLAGQVTDTLARTLYLGGAAVGNISGVITQAGSGSVMSVTKVDGGIWTLSGSQNTYTGSLTVSNGTLAVAALGDSGVGSNGSGTIILGSTGNATLQFIGNSSQTTTRPISLQGNAAIDASESSPTALLSLAGSITGAYNLTLTGSGAAGGQIAAAMNLSGGSLTKNGIGTWTLAQANAYAGGTTVNAGTLVVASTNGSALGSGSVTVNGGVLDLTGSISSSNTVNVNAGGTFTGNGFAAGSVNIAGSGAIVPVNGTLSVGGSLTLSNTAAMLSFAPSSGSASSQLSLAGMLIASASTPIFVNPLPGFGGSGAYNLVSYGSKAAGDSFVLASNTAGTSILSGTISPTGYYFYNYNVALNDTGSVLQLTASLVAPAFQDQWASATGGTWGTTSNWTRAFAPGSGNTAVFGGNLTASDFVDFGGVNHTVAAVSFSNAAASYTLGTSGGTNSLIINNAGGTGGTGSVAVAAGYQFINAPVQLLSNTDFSASAFSALFVDGGVSGSGSLSMSGSGSVSIVNAAAGANISNAITVNPGGQRTLGGANNTGVTTISGPITLAGSSLTLAAASGGTVAASGAISQSAASSLSTAGPGVIVLSGSNSYPGGTTINQGVLNAGVGNLGSGRLYLCGGTFQPSALSTSGATANYSNALNVTQNSGIDLPTALGDTYQFPSLSIGADTLTLTDGTTAAGVTISGATTISGGATFNVSVNAPLTLVGSLSGASSITKNGSGLMVLDGTGNRFTGSVTIDRGAILLNNAASLVNSTVTISASNGLAFGSGITAGTLGGLAGASNEVLQTSGSSLAAVALTVGENGQSTTYSGVLSGSGSLTLVGGDLTLSGTSNSYSGGTVIDAGTLLVTSPGALPNDSSLSVGADSESRFDVALPDSAGSREREAGGMQAPCSLLPAPCSVLPATSVPEPGTLALWLAALGLWGGTVGRRVALVARKHKGRMSKNKCRKYDEGQMTKLRRSSFDFLSTFVIRHSKASPFSIRTRELGFRSGMLPASRRLVFERLESRTLLSVGGGYTNAGILGEYYASATALSGTPVSAPYGSPAFTRQDVRIDFNWGTTGQPGGSPDPAFAGVSRNNFSVLWTGEVIPNFSQTYTFTATTVGGDVLYIRPHGSSTWTTLVNDWSVHSATADSATYALTAGQTYDIEFEYCQPTTGIATECKLHWSSPSTPDEAIEPATALGVGFDGGDAAFANMVNAGSRAYWWVPGYADTSDYVATDSNCWPEADAEIYLGEGDPSMENGGSYLVQFNGTAELTDWPQSVQFWAGGVDYGSTLYPGDGYNSATNTTAVTMVVSPDQISDGGFWMTFTNTSRDGKISNPEHNGITNLYVMQPTTYAGSTDPQPGTLFTQAALGEAAQYTTLRLMDFLDTNGNYTSNWSDRTVPGDNIWTGWQFLGGSGVETGTTDTYHDAGIPWEVCVALGNETGKDLYINIPSNASIEYIDNLADLFAYGSNGVTPYTSPQANPVWPPLNSNLKVIIEFSNEVWNSAVGFGQSGVATSGWSNQLSQRAVYDYLTNNQNDPLYPGGGANAYNDGAILAPQYITSSNEAGFLATYTANPTPGTSNDSWSSPEYFSNADSSVNGYQIYQGWVALRLEQISMAFKTALGDTGVYANATASRVRPIFEWQYGGTNWIGELSEMQAMFGSQHPVDYYLWGGGGGWYVDDQSATGFDDTEFANCDFTTPVVSGYQQAPAGASFTFNGAAGMAANGSSLGNPTAPTEGPSNAPNGSTQTAYMQPGASISQSVDFSGGWADITLFATQTSSSYNYGLTISIDGGAPLELSEGGAGYSGSSSSSSQWGWERTAAFSVTAGYHTVTFTNTSSSGGATVFIDDLGIQTVNGLFKDAAAQGVKNNTLDLMSDVALCKEWGLYDVGYEGGFDFNEDKGLDDANGYDDLGEKGDSSAVPNVGAMANLDPRAASLAMTTLDQFYNAGGTLPMVFDSSNQINGWAVAAPTYYNYNTPKQQAAAAVEAGLPPTGALPANWSSTFFGGTSLGAPPGNCAFDGTTWTLRGTGGQVDWTGNSALAALTNVSGDATLIAKMVSTQVGGAGSSRGGIILADSSNGASTTPAVELGVYGYGSSSYNNGNGIVELTAQLSNGSQDNPLAYVNVATPYMVQSGNNGAPNEIYNSPVWLKLVETGSGSNTVFTGYYSMNGTSWTEVGATTAGLVSFPHSSNVAGLVSTSIAQFTNVSVSPLLFTTPPTATPSTVTGTTCALSTQGQSTAGGIVYTWSASTVPPGVALPSFSPNASSAAQNATATFYAAGTYILTATMTDSAGNVAAQTVTVVVNQTSAVVVTPSSALLAFGAKQSFTATLQDQFANPIPFSAFTWAVTAGGGSVDANGNYTAPGALGTATLTATSSLGLITGTAAINIVAPLPAAPASLAATLISSAEIDLSWPAVAWATGYNVYRGAVSGDESAVPLNSSPLTGTSYRDLSVSGQTSYYYMVQAVNATGLGAPSAEAMATTPPPPVSFTQNVDVGSPQQAGSEQYAAGSGVYTVAGGGADIWGSSDSFHFDALSLSGDGSIVAQVTTVQGASPAAKAGLMFRDSTAANAMMAMLAVTPDAGLMFETRTATGGLVSAQLAGGFAAPIWLDLSRTGNQFAAYYCTAAVPSSTSWIPLGSSVTVPMSNTALVGLAVTAHAVAALNTSTFFGVSVSSSGEPQAVPAPDPDVLQFTASVNSLRIACAAGDADSVDVYVNSASTPASTISLSEVTQWEVLGGAGGDQLTVDFSNGNPLPAGGLSLAGGSGGEDNGLAIIGTGSADSVMLSQAQLTFDALAPIAYSNVQTVALDLSGRHCTLAGSLPTGSSLVIDGSGSITSAAGFTQAGNLTVTSGTAVLTASSDLASGASLTVGTEAASAFQASVASIPAVTALAAVTPAVPATAAAVSQTTGPSATQADIHGAAILAVVKALDNHRGIGMRWLPAATNDFWSSLDKNEASRAVLWQVRDILPGQ